MNTTITAEIRRTVVPDGWKKEGLDHDMWSYLVDDKKRRRASIFYKAAFYDRSAHINFEPFWEVRHDYTDDGVFIFARSADGDTPVKRGPFKSAWSPEADAADKECRAWLDEYAPAWKDATEYWDA